MNATTVFKTITIVGLTLTVLAVILGLRAAIEAMPGLGDVILGVGLISGAGVVLWAISHAAVVIWESSSRAR